MTPEQVILARLDGPRVGVGESAILFGMLAAYFEGAYAAIADGHNRAERLAGIQRARDHLAAEYRDTFGSEEVKR